MHWSTAAWDRSLSSTVLRRLLGEQATSVPDLLNFASGSLGEGRAGRCVQLVRLQPLSRRAQALASVAALAVGTSRVGAAWWSEARADFPSWAGLSPDDVLAAEPPAQVHTGWPPPVLDGLAYWISNVAADAEWGPAVGFVDEIEYPKNRDRIPLPTTARLGDRLVVSVEEPGCRLDAIVSKYPDGEIGTWLDRDSMRSSAPALVHHLWPLIAGPGPHRLPDEPVGGDGDPFMTPIPDQAAGEILRRWAIGRGVPVSVVGTRWETVGDAIAAMAPDQLREVVGASLWTNSVSWLVDGFVDFLYRDLEHFKTPPPES